MHLTSILPILALLATSTTSCTYSPDTIVVLYEGSTSPQGNTTSANVQRKNSVISSEISFTLPSTISPNATCSLTFTLSGANSQSNWAGFFPDVHNRVNIYTLTAPVNPDSDNGISHAPVGTLVGTLDVQASGTNNQYATATMEGGGTVPCKSGPNGFLMSPTADEIILGWEQLADPIDGLFLVVSA